MLEALRCVRSGRGFMCGVEVSRLPPSHAASPFASPPSSSPHLPPTPPPVPPAFHPPPPPPSPPPPAAQFVLAINFVLPFGNFSAYFSPRHLGPDPLVGNERLDRLLRRLVVDGDQSFCDKRLKLIPRCVEGPWAVRQVVGSRPAIIGKTLPTKVTVGDGYVEVALDVSQSKAARYVLGVVRKFTQRVRRGRGRGGAGWRDGNALARGSCVRGLPRVGAVSPGVGASQACARRLPSPLPRVGAVSPGAGARQACAQ